MQKSHNLSLKSKSRLINGCFLENKKIELYPNKHLTFLPSVKQKKIITKNQFPKVFFFKLLFHFVNLVLTGLTSGEELQLLVH